MHRLFVAIALPEAIRARLADLMEGLRGASWSDEDQLHLTLRFIGEVEHPVAEDIAAALGTVRHPRFEIALDGIGAFDRRGRPGALWAGVAPHEPLKALHRKIDHACQRVGLPPERRAYLPHVTIAQLSAGADPIAGFIARSAPLVSAPFRVEAFSLYESRLNPHGAIHRIVADYPLDQAPSAPSSLSTRPA